MNIQTSLLGLCPPESPLDQTSTLNATTVAEGIARIVLPVEFIARPEYYVLFVSTDQLLRMAVMVYTIRPLIVSLWSIIRGFSGGN